MKHLIKQFITALLILALYWQTGTSQTDTNLVKFTNNLAPAFDLYSSHMKDSALFTPGLCFQKT